MFSELTKDTRILVQGITGREASIFVRDSLKYGSNIVAGVSPGKGGSRIHGVPVFDTVQSALIAQPCDVSIISVPAPNVLEAAMEALENKINLLVIITERVPQKDVVRILERAALLGAKVVGPNSLGIIIPGETRIGMCGGSFENTIRSYTAGPVGVISRSGGMLTEIASMLTQEKIGQSTCISIGGDPIIGTTYVDLLPYYETDTRTRALVLFSEPGGYLEKQLAEYLLSHGTKIHMIAFIAGRFMDKMQGVRFGHAGTIVEGEVDRAEYKIEILENAGVTVVRNLSEIPKLINNILIKDQ